MNSLQLGILIITTLGLTIVYYIHSIDKKKKDNEFFINGICPNCGAKNQECILENGKLTVKNVKNIQVERLSNNSCCKLGEIKFTCKKCGYSSIIQS